MPLKRNQREEFDIDTVASSNDAAKVFRGILPRLPGGKRVNFATLRRELGNGLDPFALDGMLGYSFRELTDAVSRVETIPLMLESILGEKWKATRNRMVSIEEQYDSMSPAPNLPTNANPPVETRPERDVIPFEIPRFAVQSDVSPEDVENIRQFGTLGDQQSLEELMLEIIGKSLNRLKIAEELMRRGAIDGVQRVVDVHGNVRDIFNLYEMRSKPGKPIAPLAVNLKLSSGGGGVQDVSNQFLKVKRAIEMKVQGQGVSRIAVLASSDVYDSIVTHPTVQDLYKNWQAAASLMEDNRYGGFRFNGNMELFDVGQQTLPNIKGGQPYKWWADGTLKAVPIGTIASRNAPIVHKDTIGKDGKPAYVTPEVKKFGKGYETLTESHYVAWCQQLEGIANFTIT